MSLINNGVRDGGGPGWRYGSNQHATAERGKWGADNGTRNNFHYGDATQVAGVSISDKYGAPSGYRHPVSWCMGIKGGAIASYKRATISLTASASGAEGLGLSATADIAINATAVGGLVAGVSATASISLDASAEVVGLIGSTVSATLAISADAELVAKGFISASGTIDLSANVELMGLGHMVVSTIDTTTLTADNIATAVWEYLLGGTASGDLLQTAGSGGLSPTQSARLQEIWQRLGLDSAAPVVQSSTQIAFDSVVLGLSESGGEVTVTREP